MARRRSSPNYRNAALLGGFTGAALALAWISNPLIAPKYPAATVIGITLAGLAIGPLAVGANTKEWKQALFLPA